MRRYDMRRYDVRRYDVRRYAECRGATLPNPNLTLPPQLCNLTRIPSPNLGQTTSSRHLAHSAKRSAVRSKLC
jgi:hypothetical protein